VQLRTRSTGVSACPCECECACHIEQVQFVPRAKLVLVLQAANFSSRLPENLTPLAADPFASLPCQRQFGSKILPDPRQAPSSSRPPHSSIGENSRIKVQNVHVDSNALMASTPVFFAHPSSQPQRVTRTIRQFAVSRACPNPWMDFSGRTASSSKTSFPKGHKSSPNHSE